MAFELIVSEVFSGPSGVINVQIALIVITVELEKDALFHCVLSARRKIITLSA